MGIINKDGALFWATGIDNSGLHKDTEDAKKILGGLLKHSKQIGLSIGAVFGANQLKNFGQSIIRVRSEMQMLEASFETLVGANGYKKFLSEMKSFAIESPLSLTGVSKAAQTLLGFNVVAEDVLPVLKQLGDISMGSEDRFSSLALAFAQMSSVGHLMGQDLLQMINAGFNPLQEISTKTGKSISVLKDEMSKGAISSQMVADAFRSATEEGGRFYNMTQKQAEGLRGLQNQLEGSLQEAFNQIGASQQDLVASGYKGAISLVENYEQIGKTLIELVGVYGLVKAAELSWKTFDKVTGTAKYIEEAKGLEKLLSVEQKSMLSKAGLTKGTYEHALSVTALSKANIDAAKAQVSAMGTEASMLKKSMDASKLRAIAATELVTKRRDEIRIIEESGKKTRLVAAQKRLDTAITRENTAVTQKNAAMKAFHSQKALIQTASQKAATMSTVANTAAQSANANMSNVLAMAKVKLSLAMTKLNKVMAANKFTIIAIAVAALGYGLYKLITYQNDSEKAQKRLNKTVKEFETVASTESTRLEIMFNRLNRAKIGTKEYESAKQAIINQYGEYNNKLFKEMDNVDGLASVYLKLRDAVLESAKARSMQTATDNASESFAKVETKSKDEILKLLEKKYPEAQAEGYFYQIREYMESSNDKMSEELQNLISGFDKTITQQSSSLGGYTSYKTNELEEQIARIQKAAQIRDQEIRGATLKFGELPKDGVSTDYNEVEFEDLTEVIKNTSLEVDNLTTKLANLRSNKAKSSDYKSDIAKTAQELEDAEKTLLLLTGASKKAVSDSKVDTTSDVNKILRDLEIQNIKSSIDIMQDGADKQREQIKSDYNIRMSEIDKKEEELRDKQKGNITKRQEEELELSKQLANLVKEKETVEVDKKESDENKDKLQKLESDWNEYYIAYGTYQEKRLAITEEYARQISEAEGNVWKQQSLGKERDQALQDLDVSMAQQSDLWIRLFSDAEKLTTSSLQKIIQETQNLLDYLNGVEGAEIPIGFSPEQLEALKKDPEKVKSILDGMQQKIDYMNKRDPFGSVIQGFKDLNKAGSDTEKQMEATQKIIKGFGQVSDVVNQVGQAFTGISPEMDKVIGGITSIVGETSSMATTGAMLGGPVGAAIGGAIGLGTSLIKVFGSSNEMSQETIKNYQDYMSVIDELISKQKELIQSTSGSQAVIEAEKAKKLIEAQIKASREIGKEFLNSGASSGILGIGSKPSEGAKQRKALAPFRNELRKVGVDLDSLGDRVTGLFDLTADQLLRIKQEIPKLWAKLDDATRQYLEAIIDGDEKLKDLIETTQEAITGITFDEAKDSLKALLMDADTTFENISGKFDDYMRNSIMNLVMDGTMKDKLKAWYENYYDALKDDSLTEGEVDSLRDQYDSIMKDAMEERDNLLKAAGLDPKKSKSGVTGELKAEMTEGTASQLVGLWNMTAMDVRVIKDYIAKFGFNDISKELNVLLYHLNDIKTNTRDTADNTAYTEEGFKKLEDKLDKIEKNTKQNNSRG